MCGSMTCYVSAIAKIGVFATAILFQPVLGANPIHIENFANDLVQAIEPTTGNPFYNALEVTHYIPGYGLHISFERIVGIPKLDDATTQLTAALLDKGDTIEGLAKDEWISIFFRGHGDTNIYDLVIRMKQGRPDTLEVWVNGLLRD
jgi:hypothetical protein